MTWYYDQWITTHGLLLKNICTVPPWSGLWNKKGRALIRQKIFCHKYLSHRFQNLTKVKKKTPEVFQIVFVGYSLSLKK